MRERPPAGGGRPHHLRTLGTLGLSGPHAEQVLGTHGRHHGRLALLSVLAAAGDRGRSRDQLLALFWPEATHARARHSLDQLLYSLRSSVSQQLFAGVNPVRLNPDVITSDVGNFNGWLERGDAARAAAEYQGPFLDGFYLTDSPEFERWVETERARLARCYCEAVEMLARRADRAGDHDGAVRWWRELADLDPLSTRSAAGLLRALVDAGDHAAALQHAERHEADVERELGTTVGLAFGELVAKLRGAAPRGPPVLQSGVSRTPALTATVAATDAPAAKHDGADARATPAVAVHDSPPAKSAARAIWPPPERTTHRRARYVLGLLIVLATAGVTVRVVASVRGYTQNLPRQRATPGGITGAGRREPGVRIGREAFALVERGGTHNIAAHELYLRASDPTLWRSTSRAHASVRFFEQAIALDPRYAAAYAGLAQMHLSLADRRDTAVPSRERMRLGEQAALRAVALDDSSADAHAALSVARRARYDFASAEAEMKRAISLDPFVAHYHEWLVQLYVALERPVDALAEARRAIELDPLSATANAELASALCANGRYDEALALLIPLRLLRPPLLRVPHYTALCYVAQDKWADALVEIRRSAAADDPRERALLAFVLARDGRPADARHILASLLERSRRHGDVTGEIATMYTGLGDTNLAFAWLERARAEGTLLPDDLPLILTALRPDPRVDRFRRRLGY